MITTYIRPQNLADALKALALPNTIPLAGGTFINTPAFGISCDISVVDLQALGLGTIEKSGDSLEIGATTTLQALLEEPEILPALKKAVSQEATVNIRNSATIAGTLVVADGRSPLAVVMLAIDAKLTLADMKTQEAKYYGELLPILSEAISGKLILKIGLPLKVKLAWEQVSRTPADKPIISVALARWPSGRVRLALGGFGSMPILGLDGVDETGVIAAARNAMHDADDDWGSAEYRSEMAAVLAQRCLQELVE